MYQELDMIVLTYDIEEFGLKQGDIGTIVHCYKYNKAFEAEFVTADGRTIALLTLKPEEIRSLKNREVLHVRELTKITA
jgi:ATP-dependent exoDNAse (exonuclease V) alpha subunit